MKIRRIIIQFVDFFIYSNLLISIAAFLFTLQTAFVFNYAGIASAFFALTAFLSTFSLYNIRRIYQSTRPHSDPKLHWYERNRKLLFTLILVFASLYAIVLQTNYLVFKNGLLFWVPVAVLSVFYFLPPFALKRLPFFKLFIIAFVWTFSSVFIPLLYNDSTFSLFDNFKKDEIAYLISQFCFIAALCVPFDIRDVENDRQNSIKTLPVHFGLSKAKTFGVLLLLLYMVFAQDTKQALAYFITGSLGILLILYASEHKHRYYFSVLVDGLIIFQFALISFLFGSQ